jgi:hypothetical protein
MKQNKTDLKWLPCDSKEEFDEFKKKYMLVCFKHLKGFQYYGHADKTAWAKCNKQTNEYYINIDILKTL